MRGSFRLDNLACIQVRKSETQSYNLADHRQVAHELLGVPTL